MRTRRFMSRSSFLSVAGLMMVACATAPRDALGLSTPGRSARFNEPAPGGGDPPAPGGGGAAEPTAAELKIKLDAATAQLSTLTTERDTFKTKADEFENAKKTDAEKQADKITAAERDRDAAAADAKAARVQLAIEREARKLNIMDEDAAVRLLDDKAIQFDKDGKPTNIAALLTDLVKAKPYLIKSEGPGGGGGGASNPARTRNGADAPKDRLSAIQAHYAKN